MRPTTRCAGSRNWNEPESHASGTRGVPVEDPRRVREPELMGYGAAAAPHTGLSSL